MKKYGTISIGIDQSYQNTGISLIGDGNILKVKSVQLSKYKVHSQKRAKLRQVLQKVLQVATKNAENVVCIIERARLHGGPNNVINLDAIKSIGALSTLIVDECAIYDVEVFSVDTRCWKSQVIGTSQSLPNNFGVPPEKWPTVRWVISKGFESAIIIPITNKRKTKGIFVRNGKKYQYNHDAADSAGIGMFWFVGDHNKLHIER